MADTIPKAMIDDLNLKANQLIESGIDDYLSYQAAAADAHLIFVRYAGGNPWMAGTTEGPQREIHRDSVGRLVNLWIAGDVLGFDDQID